MNISVIELKSGLNISGKIEMAKRNDMPLKKNGWNFSWRKLFKVEGAELYKISLEKEPQIIQGILMVTLMFDEMLYMNNIEIAPHNIGSKGKYAHIAGCLIAYGCLLSFEYGKGGYKGYLTFESKTELIPLYIERYGAMQVSGQRMFIAPKIGLKLIDKYLKEDEQ